MDEEGRLDRETEFHPPATVTVEGHGVETVPGTPDTPQEFRNVFDIAGMLGTAGRVELNEEQKGILYAPVVEEDVEIRPDGLIYLPWMEYVTRLNRAFGLEWALIPQGMPKVKGNSVMWGFHLIVKGSLMGYAIGEQEYQPGNKKMSFTDACEGAKSNALMRLCKGLGISLELWKPSFIREWKEKYAESYKGERYGREVVLWRKKGERKQVATAQSTSTGDTPSVDSSQPTSQEDELKAAVKTLYDGLMFFYDKNKNVVRSVIETLTTKESFKELTLEEVKNVTNYFQLFQAHANTCVKVPKDNACGKACIHQALPYVFCEAVGLESINNKDFVCPYDKSAWGREVR